MDEFKSIKPLTDDDIANIITLISKKGIEHVDKANKLFVDFKNGINVMIGMLDDYLSVKDGMKKSLSDEDIEEKAELDRLKRLIGFTPDDQLFLRCKDKIWVTRNHLVNKNIDWFINIEYNHLIKKDQNKTFIETLIGIFKNIIKDLNDNQSDVEQKNKYWAQIHYLLNIVARFQALIQ
jgi:hypothetical protein